jgi:hypothetical protein
MKINIVKTDDDLYCLRDALPDCYFVAEEVLVNVTEYELENLFRDHYGWNLGSTASNSCLANGCLYEALFKLGKEQEKTVEHAYMKWRDYLKQHELKD